MEQVKTKRFYKGTLGASANIYTLPLDAKLAVVKSITICNTTASDVTVTMSITGVPFLNAKKIAANDTLIFSELDQVLDTQGDYLAASASVTAAISVLVSGKEVY